MNKKTRELRRKDAVRQASIAQHNAAFNARLLKCNALSLEAYDLRSQRDEILLPWLEGAPDPTPEQWERVAKLDKLIKAKMTELDDAINAL